MFDKIKEIKDKYPVAFWIICLGVFPIGLFLLIWFLMVGKTPTDRDLLDKASRDQGAADANEQQAAESADAAAQEYKTIKQRQQELLYLYQKLGKKAEVYKKQSTEPQDHSWDSIDKEAGIK